MTFTQLAAEWTENQTWPIPSLLQNGDCNAEVMSVNNVIERTIFKILRADLTNVKPRSTG